MAFAQHRISSVTKEQVALVCELCENDPKLKWKCLECGLMMCQRCRDKVHTKFQSTVDHTIIDIKDICTHQDQSKPDFTKLKCSEHAGQNCCLYCKTCNELVCPLCISKTHNKHDLTEISDGYKIQLEIIKNEQEKMQKGIQNLSQREEELRKIKFLEELVCKKSKQGIQEYKKSMISAIEKHCDELLSELEQKWSNVSKSVKDEKQRVNEAKETLLKQHDEVNSLCQSRDLTKAFSKTFLKSMKTDINPAKAIFDPVPNFVPGELSKFSLLYGKLVKVNISHNTDLSVVQKFQTKCDKIENLIVCHDDSLWMTDGRLRRVQKAMPVRGILEVKYKLSLDVNDMILTPSGNLLLSVVGSSSLKAMSSSTMELKNSIYNVSPLQPLGIHMTNDNKLIIGAMNLGPAWPATGPKQVIVIDQSGRRENVFQDEKNGTPLFTLPVGLASNNRNKIGVIDWLSEDKGRVVILDQDGDVNHIYSGHSRINNTENPFRPLSIKTTPSDNFLVTDYTNHILHILSSKGKIITYYNTIEIGIELPWSLSFNHTGHLYIGCGNYEDGDKKAIICKLDNFLW